MGIIIFIAIFVVVALVIIKVGMGMSPAKKMSKKRLAELIDADDNFTEIHDDFTENKSGIATAMENFVGNFRKTDVDEGVNMKLYRAGMTSPNAAAYYLFFSSFGWVIGLGLLFLFYQSAKQNPGLFWAIMLFGVVMVILSTFGAQLWVKNQTDKRQKILIRSFPDTLDLLLVCVESGLALDASLARVCKELKFAHPEMTKELNRTRVELTMLNDREKALNNLSRRTDLIAVKSLVAALLQSEKFGTSLTETLRVLSDDYRHTRMMIAEEKAGKLPTKITVSTLPLMLMALLILIASPAGIKACSTLQENHVNQN